MKLVILMYCSPAGAYMGFNYYFEILRGFELPCGVLCDMDSLIYL